MVAAVSTPINPKTTTQNQNPTRPPLLPSDPDNALASRRPKSREVTSRYMSSSSSSSSSSSKRCPSPLVSRTTQSTAMMSSTPSAPPSTIKRSQSVERNRRPVTPRPNSLDLRISNGCGGELTSAQKMLFTSTRSLSVSFQGGSFSLQVSKAKPTPSPSVARKAVTTPERRKAVTTPTPTPTARNAGDQVENSKPVEHQQRWPGRLRQANSMSRSMDCSDDRRKLSGSGSNNVVRALQNSMIDNRTSFDNSTGSDVNCDNFASDTESVSSGSTSGGTQEVKLHHHHHHHQQQRTPRGVVVPARFWQESNNNNRLRRQTEPPGSPPVSKNNSGLFKSMATTTTKLIAPKKFGVDSPLSSPKGVVNSRGQLSPIRGPVRTASPSKLVTSSPMRGMSPSRVRNGVVAGNSSNLSNTPSILSFAADVRRGKVGENRVFDAHLLRLLYNRLLQWRFVNARTDAALSAQRLNAEKSLYNAWVATSKLRESVRAKRTELQLLRQNMKLTSILKGQMMHLEEWALMDRDYSSSLLGAIEALRASTLRLPVVGGARADVQKVKDAICSAVDVMQAMASSICLLLSKVGEVNSLVAELANASAKERALLDQCKDLLSTIAAIQVKEFSLRTHILQMQRLPSSLTMKV